MSTILILFRVDSKQQLEQQTEAIKNMCSDPGWNKILSRDGGVQLQVFETPKGTYYRVLERGYFVENKLWASPTLYPGIFYDSRAMDIDDEAESMGDIIDGLIRTQSYDIIEIVKSTED